jgi:hypothetical protein
MYRRSDPHKLPDELPTYPKQRIQSHLFTTDFLNTVALQERGPTWLEHCAGGQGGFRMGNRNGAADASNSGHAGVDSQPACERTNGKAEDASFQSRRRWPRFAVDMPVQVRVTTQGPTRVIGCQGQGTDLSGGGLAVTADIDLPVGAQIGVEFIHRIPTSPSSSAVLSATVREAATGSSSLPRMTTTTARQENCRRDWRRWEPHHADRCRSEACTGSCRFYCNRTQPKFRTRIFSNRA